MTLEVSKDEASFLLKLLDKELRQEGLNTLQQVVGLYNLLILAQQKESQPQTTNTQE
jgi:hypothetical protein